MSIVQNDRDADRSSARKLDPHPTDEQRQRAFKTACALWFERYRRRFERDELGR
jgi:hypothetical protein